MVDYDGPFSAFLVHVKFGKTLNIYE